MPLDVAGIPVTHKLQLFFCFFPPGPEGSTDDLILWCQGKNFLVAPNIAPCTRTNGGPGYSSLEVPPNEWPIHLVNGNRETYRQPVQLDKSISYLVLLINPSVPASPSVNLILRCIFCSLIQRSVVVHCIEIEITC